MRQIYMYVAIIKKAEGFFVFIPDISGISVEDVAFLGVASYSNYAEVAEQQITKYLSKHPAPKSSGIMPVKAAARKYLREQCLPPENLVDVMNVSFMG